MAVWRLWRYCMFSPRFVLQIAPLKEKVRIVGQYQCVDSSVKQYDTLSFPPETFS